MSNRLIEAFSAAISVFRGKTYSAIPTYRSSASFSLWDFIPGAWQRNLANPASGQNVLAFSAVYACISLIAGDVSKLRLLITERQVGGIWQEISGNSPFLPVLAKPNPYQTLIQFISNWIVSKLIYGNAYVLKERDNRGGENAGIVRALYVLDPCNVTPLVAENGDVYYRLRRDNLAGVDDEGDVVSASEIIHDRMLCLWHPLVGVSPIYACGMSATQGVKIQQNSSKFFANMSRPSGVLTAPGKISDETAARIKKASEENFGGDNIGRLAVMGDGLTYAPMTIPPVEAQLIEQLRWTVEDVARVFHVPPYKLGLNTNVTFANAGQLDQDYYSQCLQTLIESLEACLVDGLGLPSNRRIQFDLDGLLRMDPLGQAETNAKRIGAGELAPNEARRKQNLPPVVGGDTPYLQMQNYALAALAKRDALDDPFGKSAPAPDSAPSAAKDATDAILRRLDDIDRGLQDGGNEFDAAEFLNALARRCDAETKGLADA